VPRRWNREETWEEWIRVRDAIETAVSAHALVAKEAGSAKLRFRVEFVDPPSHLSTEDLDELRRELDQVPDDEVSSLVARVEAPWEYGKLESVLVLTRLLTPMRLTIEGENRTAVEGIYAQLRDTINRVLRGAGGVPQDSGSPPEPEVDSQPRVTFDYSIDEVAERTSAGAEDANPHEAARASPPPSGISSQFAVAIVGGAAATVVGGIVLYFILG
jgi:hypothetical protein